MKSQRRSKHNTQKVKKECLLRSDIQNMLAFSAKTPLAVNGDPDSYTNK